MGSGSGGSGSGGGGGGSSRGLQSGNGDGGHGVVVDRGSNGAYWWQCQGCYRVVVVKVAVATGGGVSRTMMMEVVTVG